MDTTTTKDKLARFGRSLALLLNRSLMYQKTHPMVQNSIKEVHEWAELLFNIISPVVFILNRELFYVDEEQLDPRINIKRIAHLFKTHGIQSVSFEYGLMESEIDIFIDLFSSMTTTTNADIIKKELLKKGAYNIKVNHVLYKKVTEDDQVVSREALKQVTPSMEDDDSLSRKKFMDTLLETILTDEFANTLNIKSLMANPTEVSKNMIQADLASAKKMAPGVTAGTGRETGPDGTGGSGVGTGTGGTGNGMPGTGGGSAGPGAGGPGGPGGTATGTGTAGTGDGMPGAGGTTAGPGAGGPGGPGGTATGTGTGGTGDGMPGAGGGSTGPGAGGPGGPGGTATGTGTGGTGDGMPGAGGTTAGQAADGPDGTGEPATGAGTGGTGDGLPGAGDGTDGQAGDEPDGAGGPGMGTATDRPGDGTPTARSVPTTASVGATASTHASLGSATGAQTLAEGKAPSTDMSGRKEIDLPQTKSAGSGHGQMLLHQLDLMQQEVQKHIEGGGDISLEALADAVFEMKKQLFEDIQTQKALGIAYNNEDAIVDNINELTDQVLLSLIKEEYNDGKITTQRLAQIILRLIPDANELKRLLPKIKQVLLECGMLPDDYLLLVDELKSELQNEDLTRILEDSSEAIGIDTEDLIAELKDDSGQAAKLIYLASEIRKGGGDESALADILVDYVEKRTAEAALENEGEGGDDHLKKVISDVESTVLGQLAKMDVGQDVLLRMEDRINNRMDSILDRMRVDWLQSQAGNLKREKMKPLTVLQTIEHHVGDDELMEDILKEVRSKVDAGEIEENNFSEIHEEIDRQKKLLIEQAESLEKPEGVLSPKELIFILEKEIARANRYNSPFSALAFSFVNIKPKMKALEDLISNDAVMNAALDKLVNTIREVDYIGQIGKNKMVALLPMQTIEEARLALRRIMNLLHNEPLQVRDVPVLLRVAGIASEFDVDQTPEAHMFAKKLSNQLMDMVSRLKNIQVLF